MAEPENQTLRILREVRDEMKEFRGETAKNFERIEEPLNSVAQAVVGEGVLGRYAAAEVEERLAAIEKRLSALEQRR